MVLPVQVSCTKHLGKRNGFNLVQLRLAIPAGHYWHISRWCRYTAVECEGEVGADHVAVEDEGKSKSLQRNARPNLSAKANLFARVYRSPNHGQI